MIPTQMNPRQQQTVQRLQADLTSLAAAQTPPPRQRLKTFLTQLNAAWFDDHAADPALYAQELALWNMSAGWQGTDLAQVAEWNGHLLTPKFFGGAVEKLADDYVLSLSLNHKKGDGHAFLVEVSDTQTEAQRLAHCFEYFQRHYVYTRFFKPRGLALEAYRSARTPGWTSTACAAHAGWVEDGVLGRLALLKKQTREWSWQARRMRSRYKADNSTRADRDVRPITLILQGFRSTRSLACCPRPRESPEDALRSQHRPGLCDRRRRERLCREA